MKKGLCINILITLMLFVSIMITVCLWGMKSVNAGASTLSVKLYESDNGFETLQKVNSLSTGSRIGELYINGNIDKRTIYSGVDAYGVDGSIVLSYQKSGKYQDKSDGKQWHLINSRKRWVDNTKLSKKIGNGTIVIEQSTDGKSWKSACSPIHNCFTDKKMNLSSIMSIPEEDIFIGVGVGLIQPPTAGLI